MASEIYDITIIGAGPIGLYAAATAGEMGAACNIIESRLHLGGIMMAAYPDKDVYNFPGIATIKGRDLINDLIHKAMSYGLSVRLGEYVLEVSRGTNGSLVIKTGRGNYLSSAVIITTGLKAFSSGLAEYIRIREWDGSRIYESWPSPETLKNRSIALLCDSTSRLKPLQSIASLPSSLTLILEKNVADEESSSVTWPENLGAEIYRHPWRLREITGVGIPEFIVLINDETREERTVAVDIVIGFCEGQARQTVFSRWGIEMLGQHIKVDQQMQTNVKDIYGAGDIVWYPGKIKLLSAGVHEAKIAVKNALRNI